MISDDPTVLDEGMDMHEVPVSARPSLLSLLLVDGVASEQELRLAAATAMGEGQRLGEVVLARGWLDEERLASLLARQWGLAHLEEEAAMQAAVEPTLLPPEQARALGACGVVLQDGTSTVAIVEPTSDRLADLQATLDELPSVSVVSAKTFEQLLARLATKAEETLAAELRAATTALTAIGARVEQLATDRGANDERLSQLDAALEETRRALQEERRRNQLLKTRLEDILVEFDAPS